MQDNPALTSVPISMSNLAGLKRVNLRSTRLDELPANLIKNWSALTELSIRENSQIENLPGSIGRLVSLVKLDCNGCSIVSIPEEIGNLQNLAHLDFRKNQLSATSFPRSFSKLSNLHRLYLGNNNIDHLPEQITELTSLTELDLSNNLIYSIWEDIGGLKSLERLLLNSNKLEAIPSSLKYVAWN